MNRNLQAVIEAFTAGLFAISAILTALRTVTAWDDLYTDPLTFDRPIMGRMALHGGGTEVNLLGVIAQPTNLILWGLLAAAVAAAILHVVGRLQERFGPPLPRALNIGLLAATAAPWVAEGKPIPVRDYSFAAATVGPVKKAALLTVHTREAGRAAYAEAAFTALLKRDAARSLDAAIFANTAATTSASAGLLHGVTPLPATVADTLEDMMIEDLANLASVVTTAGGHDVVFVAAPQQAAAAAIRKPELAARIWPSPALAAGTVVALDPAAFVSGFDPLPVIDSSADTVVHMEDDTPAQIGSAGDPPVAAAPARSMFQTDTVAVRLIFEMAFALAAPTIASVERVKW